MEFFTAADREANVNVKAVAEFTFTCGAPMEFFSCEVRKDNVNVNVLEANAVTDFSLTNSVPAEIFILAEAAAREGYLNVNVLEAKAIAEFSFTNGVPS